MKSGRQGRALSRRNLLARVKAVGLLTWVDGLEPWLAGQGQPARAQNSLSSRVQQSATQQSAR